MVECSLIQRYRELACLRVAYTEILVYHSVSVPPEEVAMPLYLQGTLVYRIGEALSAVGVSRATYFRWIQNGRVCDVQFRDRNGRRVFTAQEVLTLATAADRLVEWQTAEADPAQLELSGSDNG